MSLPSPKPPPSPTQNCCRASDDRAETVASVSAIVVPPHRSPTNPSSRPLRAKQLTRVRAGQQMPCSLGVDRPRRRSIRPAAARAARAPQARRAAPMPAAPAKLPIAHALTLLRAREEARRKGRGTGGANGCSVVCVCRDAPARSRRWRGSQPGILNLCRDAPSFLVLLCSASFGSVFGLACHAHLVCLLSAHDVSFFFLLLWILATDLHSCSNVSISSPSFMNRK